MVLTREDMKRWGETQRPKADTKTETKPDTDMTDICTLVVYLLKDFMFRVYMRREFTYIASVFFVIVTSIVFVIIAISWCTWLYLISHLCKAVLFDNISVVCTMKYIVVFVDINVICWYIMATNGSRQGNQGLWLVSPFVIALIHPERDPLMLAG